jgi:hypothetical protein
MNMQPNRPPVRRQRAIIATSHNLSEVNHLIDNEKWEVVSETPIDGGALLILQRDEYGPLVTLN